MIESSNVQFLSHVLNGSTSLSLAVDWYEWRGWVRHFHRVMHNCTHIVLPLFFAFLVFFLLFLCYLLTWEGGGRTSVMTSFSYITFRKMAPGPVTCVMGLWFTHGSRPSAFELSRGAQIIFGRPDGLVWVDLRGRRFDDRPICLTPNGSDSSSYTKAFDGVAFGLSSMGRRYLILGCASHELTYLFISPDPVAVARNDWEREREREPKTMGRAILIKNETRRACTPCAISFPMDGW